MAGSQPTPRSTWRACRGTLRPPTTPWLFRRSRRQRAGAGDRASNRRSPTSRKSAPARQTRPRTGCDLSALAARMSVNDASQRRSLSADSSSTTVAKASVNASNSVRDLGSNRCASTAAVGSLSDLRHPGAGGSRSTRSASNGVGNCHASTSRMSAESKLGRRKSLRPLLRRFGARRHRHSQQHERPNVVTGSLLHPPKLFLVDPVNNRPEIKI